MLSVKTVLDNVSVGVDEVQDSVSIVLLASSEDAKLVHGAEVAERFLQVLPQLDVEATGGRLARLVRDKNIEFEDTVLIGAQPCVELIRLITCQLVKLRVQQCLVHVEYQQFLTCLMSKVDLAAFDFLLLRPLEHSTYVKELFHINVDKVVKFGAWRLFYDFRLLTVLLVPLNLLIELFSCLFTLLELRVN